MHTRARTFPESLRDTRCPYYGKLLWVRLMQVAIERSLWQSRCGFDTEGDVYQVHVCKLSDTQCPWLRKRQVAIWRSLAKSLWLRQRVATSTNYFVKKRLPY